MSDKPKIAFYLCASCGGCATHSLPGQMPLVVRIYEKDGTLKKELVR